VNLRWNRVSGFVWLRVPAPARGLRAGVCVAAEKCRSSVLVGWGRVEIHRGWCRVSGCVWFNDSAPARELRAKVRGDAETCRSSGLMEWGRVGVHHGRNRVCGCVWLCATAPARGLRARGCVCGAIVKLFGWNSAKVLASSCM